MTSNPQLRADIRNLTTKIGTLETALAVKQSKTQRDAVVAGLRARVGQLERENMMLTRRLGE